MVVQGYLTPTLILFAGHVEISQGNNTPIVAILKLPGEGVADVQTTLRVHLYCPSMPENTGEHLLKQLFNHVKEFTYMNVCSHAVPFSLFHVFSCAFTYSNVFSHAFTCFFIFS